VFAPLAWLLAAFYAVWPSYGFAIVALTATVLVVLSPLTLHQAKAMMGMQRLQPELRRLRQLHKEDRQRLNRETIALYQRHGINPASGCLPMLVQLPVMIVMYRLIRGLTFHDSSGALTPRYIDHGSSLYRSLHDHGGQMMSWGMDLSTSALSPHGSVAAAAPFFALGVLVVATSFWQQHVALARTTAYRGGDAPPGQGLVRVMPAFTGLIAVSLPAGVGVYYLISNLFRVGQQHLLTRLHPPLHHTDVTSTRANLDAARSPQQLADTDRDANRAARDRKRRAAKRRKRSRRR